MLVFNAVPDTVLDENLRRPLRIYSAVAMPTIKKYIGDGSINVPEYGPLQIDFEIDANSAEDAYTKYDAAFAAEIKRLEEDSKKSKVVAPKKKPLII